MQLVPVNLPLPEVCDTAPKADRQLSVFCRYTERKRTVICSVTKDQSGWWGFTVKQVTTTPHEDSAAYTVSATSLTIEVEAVTHALRWLSSRGYSRTTHAILLTDSVNLVQTMTSGMGGPGRNVSMVYTHLRKFLCVYCPGHPAEKGGDRADRLTGKATTTSDLRLRRSEVLRSLRHCIRAQSQGHHTNGRLDERGAERRSARRSSSKG